MAHLGPIAGHRYGYNIEPDIILPVSGKNVVLGGFHDEFGLLVGDKFFGITKAQIRPGFHLHKNQQFTFLGNEVNFGVLVPVVTRQNLVAVVGQKAGSLFFTGFTGIVVLGHERWE